MALEFADRVRETSITTGTGTLNLDGTPKVDLQTFVVGVGDTSTVHYMITDGTDWEVGQGVVTDASPDTLSRDIVHDSSNSGALVDFAAGTKQVFITAPAGHIAAISGKNFIIGGNFDTNPWQEGTTFPSTSTGTDTADMWKWAQSGIGIVDVDKVSDAPTVAQVGFKATNCLEIAVTTLDATIGSSDNYRIRTLIEGYDWAQIAQNDFVISFWHKHTKTGTYCVSFRNSGADRSFVSEYTQSVSDTWEEATIKVTASPSAGSWNYTNGIGILVSFALATGGDSQTTADSWNTGSFTATSNQVNAMDSTSNRFRIDLVNVEKGEVVTDLERKSRSEVLALCQRHFEKNYNIGVTPATVTAVGAYNVTCNGTSHFETVEMSVGKRATPTITLYNQNDGATGSWRDQSASADITVAATNVGDSAFTVAMTSSVDGNRVRGFWTADSRL